MFDVSDDTVSERIAFAMLLGVMFGAALGTTVLPELRREYPFPHRASREGDTNN